MTNESLSRPRERPEETSTDFLQETYLQFLLEYGLDTVNDADGMETHSLNAERPDCERPFFLSITFFSEFQLFGLKTYRKLEICPTDDGSEYPSNYLTR